MRLVLQRVNHASVDIEGRPSVSIGKGILVFIGIGKEDGPEDVRWCTSKILSVRLFSDPQKKMNRSIVEANGEILVVSQFTLYGNCRQGTRPDFGDAAPPEKAKELYEAFVAELEKGNVSIKTGIFQAHMNVVLENDGPVTLLVDSKKTF